MAKRGPSFADVSRFPQKSPPKKGLYHIPKVTKAKKKLGLCIISPIKQGLFKQTLFQKAFFGYMHRRYMYRYLYRDGQENRYKYRDCTDICTICMCTRELVARDAVAYYVDMWLPISMDTDTYGYRYVCNNAVTC